MGGKDIPQTEKGVVSPLIRPAVAVLAEDAPVVVDIEEFQYTYRCKHCGHQWSEVRDTERKFEAPEGYTGD